MLRDRSCREHYVAITQSDWSSSNEKHLFLMWKQDSVWEPKAKPLTSTLQGLLETNIRMSSCWPRFVMRVDFQPMSTVSWSPCSAPKMRTLICLVFSHVVTVICIAYFTNWTASSSLYSSTNTLEGLPTARDSEAQSSEVLRKDFADSSEPFSHAADITLFTICCKLNTAFYSPWMLISGHKLRKR